MAFLFISLRRADNSDTIPVAWDSAWDRDNTFEQFSALEKWLDASFECTYKEDSRFDQIAEYTTPSGGVLRLCRDGEWLGFVDIDLSLFVEENGDLDKICGEIAESVAMYHHYTMKHYDVMVQDIWITLRIYVQAGRK